jgi:hypothetical protein
VRFLDDARTRNILRTVGPVYQFRHARLQDWLAEPSESVPPDRYSISNLLSSLGRDPVVASIVDAEVADEGDGVAVGICDGR